MPLGIERQDVRVLADRQVADDPHCPQVDDEEGCIAFVGHEKQSTACVHGHAMRVGCTRKLVPGDDAIGARVDGDDFVACLHCNENVS